MEKEWFEDESRKLGARLSAADNAGWALKVQFDDLKVEYAALCQRADEAARAENEACAKIADNNWNHEAIATAIRARIAPKGEP